MGNEFGYVGKDLRDLAGKPSINDETDRVRNRNRASGTERGTGLLFSGDCKTVDYSPKAEV